MAWTAPMTAVAGAAWTAAQFNAHIRDNLLETAPGKATTATAHFVASGANAIVQRTSSQDFITTSQPSSSTGFTDLATVGPTVTVTTGTQALVVWGCRSHNDTANGFAYMSVAISGATTLAAADDNSYLTRQTSATVNQWLQGGQVKLFTGLTAGSNTFTAKYRVSANQGTWDNRHLMVFPL